MNEDTRTLNAFLTAVAQLQEPLPSDVMQQLHAIEQELPESVYKLIGLAEQFEPLHTAYVSALRAQPKEGERLKSVATATTSVTAGELDELLFQLRYQIALLQEARAQEIEMSDQELARWQNSVEAEGMEQQWMETFANSQDVLAALADEALEEFRQGRTQPLDF